MKKARIHISHLLTSGSFNITNISYSRNLSDSLVLDKHQSSTFLCLKFKNAIVEIDFDNKFAKLKEKRFKNDFKDYLILSYINKNPNFFMKKRKSFYVFSNFIKDTIFNAKTINAHCRMNRYINEFKFDEDYFRIFFIKPLIFFAPMKLILSELSKYRYSDTKNKQLISEYDNLTKSPISKHNISRVNKFEENFLMIEMVINQIESKEELEKFKNDLKFLIKNIENEEKDFREFYRNQRKKFRLFLKKKFENRATKFFLDNLVYLTIDDEIFLNKINYSIQHLDKYYS